MSFVRLSAAALVALWRSAAAFPLKAGALTLAAILATPYSLDYDLVTLAPAIAFLAAVSAAQAEESCNVTGQIMSRDAITTSLHDRGFTLRSTNALPPPARGS